MTTINLPFPPSVNNMFVNVRGRGRVRSDRYLTWSVAAGWDIKAQHVAHIAGPVAVTLAIEEKKGRRDLDNLCKPVLDLLVEHRILDGDDSKTVRAIALTWSSEVKGCRVTIQPVEAA